MKKRAIVNSNGKSKINWVTGLGTVVVAIVNAGAKMNLVSPDMAATINQLVALLIPPLVFILRSFFTVKEV